MTSKFARWATTLMLSLVAIAAIYPIAFMVVNSFKTPLEFLRNPLGLPEDWSNIDNFVALSSRFDVVQLLLNTAWYAATAQILCLAIAVPASYALAKLTFRGSRFVLGCIIASMGIPIVAILIPDYLLFVHLGLTDSPISVISIWCARGLPGSIFLLTALLRALPSELIDAAKIDGASYPRMMLSVVVPLSVPGLVTALIFNLTGFWNDLLIPLVFLQTEQKQTITGGIATIGQRMAAADYPLTIAALLVSSMAPIVLYIFLQGYIRKGLVLGSLK